VNARLVAQEMVVSQELASMWADWVRFRLNESAGGGGALGVLHLSDLAVGSQGDFFNDTGSFHFGGGDPRDLPTFNKNVYRGYLWRITAARNFAPQYRLDNNALINWDLRSDGATTALPARANAPANLVEVELTIVRGARSYRHNYVFSGVGLRYD
jgi:hypothetical protein